MSQRVGLVIRSLTLPLDITKGKTGLFYATCPLIPGLLVEETSQEAAFTAARMTIKALAAAAFKEGASS